MKGDLMNNGAQNLALRTEKVWKKGDIAKSQAEVYTKLPKGFHVLFYEEGCEGSQSFKIEIAIDPIPSQEYYLNYDEIIKEVVKNSRQRKYCHFNQ